MRDKMQVFNTKNRREQRNSLMWIAPKAEPPMGKLVQQHINQVLLNAAAEGDFELVARAVREGAKINIQDGDGWTPLMHASYEGHARIALFLLKCGADAEITDKFGKTAIDLAQEFGNVQIAAMISSHNTGKRQKGQQNGKKKSQQKKTRKKHKGEQEEADEFFEPT